MPDERRRFKIAVGGHRDGEAARVGLNPLEESRDGPRPGGVGDLGAGGREDAGAGKFLLDEGAASVPPGKNSEPGCGVEALRCVMLRRHRPTFALL